MNPEAPIIITLSSDLGEQEPFAAAIKGVLLNECPQARLVDLGHQISRHNITEAALFLLGSAPYFPPGTIHLVSVAPGPESLVARISGQYVICSDNGLITLLARHAGGVEGARRLVLPEDVASGHRHISFSREVFAIAAAALANGRPFEELGEPLPAWKTIDWPQPARSGKQQLDGAIMHIDRFGNLVTNIHHSHLEGREVNRVEAGNATARGLSAFYDDVDPGRCLAIFGHSGYLEVAYNRDRASDRTGLSPGIKVRVFLKKG